MKDNKSKPGYKSEDLLVKEKRKKVRETLEKMRRGGPPDREPTDLGEEEVIGVEALDKKRNRKSGEGLDKLRETVEKGSKRQR